MVMVTVSFWLTVGLSGDMVVPLTLRLNVTFLPAPPMPRRAMKAPAATKTTTTTITISRRERCMLPPWCADCGARGAAITTSGGSDERRGAGRPPFGAAARKVGGDGQHRLDVGDADQLGKADVDGATQPAHGRAEPDREPSQRERGGGRHGQLPEQAAGGDVDRGGALDQLLDQIELELEDAQAEEDPGQRPRPPAEGPAVKPARGA